MRVLVMYAVLLMVSVGLPAAPAAAAEAIAFPTTGALKIAKMANNGALSTIINVVSPVPVPVPATTRIEGEVAIQIAGLPATMPFSGAITSTSFMVANSIQAKVDPSVLRTPAGEVPLDVDLTVQPPIMGGPTRLTFRLHGENGTGLFESIRVVGALRGEEGRPSKTTISVSGPFFLTFGSVDDARAAAERGLAANTTLTEEQRAQFLERVTAALSQAQERDIPTDVAAAAGALPNQTVSGPPPDRAVVEHAVRREGDRVRISLRIVVPAGDAKQPVRVVAAGTESTRTVYEGVHAPGDVLHVEVEGTEPLIIQVYVAGRTAAEIRSQQP